MSATNPLNRQEMAFDIDYVEYLDGDKWPSKGTLGGIEFTEVRAMAPQYAAAALAKLIRWAVYAPTGQLLTIDEVGAREDVVRRSPLGRAFAARAQSLHNPDDVHALNHEHPVPMSDLAATIIDVILDRTPLEGHEAAALTALLVVELTGRYTVARKDP